MYSASNYDNRIGFAEWTWFSWCHGKSRAGRSTLEMKQPIVFSRMNFEGSMRVAVLYQSRTILSEMWEVISNQRSGHSWQHPISWLEAKQERMSKRPSISSQEVMSVSVAFEYIRRWFLRSYIERQRQWLCRWKTFILHMYLEHVRFLSEFLRIHFNLY